MLTRSACRAGALVHTPAWHVVARPALGARSSMWVASPQSSCHGSSRATATTTPHASDASTRR
eukprot:3265876-Alexandrium_andersonii.AAC.1